MHGILDLVPSIAFAHLSDMHLAGYEDGAVFDEDADIRRELERDLQTVSGECGGIGALLLGGDTAGRGLRREFEKAWGWVDSLCSQLDVSADRVYCVPGNHDVTWDVIRDDPVLQAVQRRLLGCPIERLRQELEPLLSRGPNRGLLLSPLDEYNEFAARYGCDVSPERHCWEQVFQLGPATIRIVGITSALLSGPDDARTSEDSKLALGPLGSSLARADDTFTILLCHHPLNWLRDGDTHAHLVERAHLQLFGHEHLFDAAPIGAGVRVHAGAVHPERGSGERWEPSYNVIRLDVADQVPSPVGVTIWSRRLLADGTFGPRDAGAPTEHHSITLLGHDAPEVLGPPSEPAPAPTSTLERQLAREFSGLSVERRQALGRSLGLLTFEDADLDEAAVGRLVFHRARQQGRLDELEQEMKPDG